MTKRLCAILLLLTLGVSAKIQQRNQVVKAACVELSHAIEKTKHNLRLVRHYPEEVLCELRAMRKQMFEEMEEKLRAGKSPEDSLFYYHPSDDRIVLSHALFWVMTQSLKGKIAKEKNVLLLRQYEEEMLDAYQTDNAYFPELLRYCNILFEFLPIILHHICDFASDKAARNLATIAIVAAGYGGDMPEDLANELLDDMDFHYNKVKCRKIEQLLPRLNQMVAEEMI